MPQFPTATTPNVGDLILVGQGASVAPGLYVVLNATAPYAVAPADSGSPWKVTPGTVPQAAVLSVYRSD